MKVTLISHSKIAESFLESLGDAGSGVPYDSRPIALTAIRTCYSPLHPSDIVATEGEKYFGKEATDGEGGTEADRLFRHITRSGHTSTLEHITYSFAVEGVSRSLLAQLTRHRQFSFSVQSQRYVKFGAKDKSGGFSKVVPPTIQNNPQALEFYEEVMFELQAAYDQLRTFGVPAEDARFVLPNAAECNLVMTGNLRAILEFYGKRKKGNGAQWEIAELAEQLRNKVEQVDPWTASYFNEV